MAPDEIHLWLARPEGINDSAILARCEAVLSDDERQRYRRFLRESDRQRFLIAHALLRDVLSRYVPVPSAAWQFERDRHGKPRLVGPAGHACDFNLSHTTGLVVCVVTKNAAVGVDVEDLRRTVNVEMARGVFSPAEMAVLRGLSAAEQQHRFFDFWTLKEAYAKARGLGFVLPLAECTFRVVSTESPRVEFSPGLDDDPAAWQFWQRRIEPDHAVAVACRCADEMRLIVRETVPFSGPEP